MPEAYGSSKGSGVSSIMVSVAFSLPGRNFVGQRISTPEQRLAPRSPPPHPAVTNIPGEAYRAAPAEGLPCLAMLGAKSTCKDRWRQVLAEAAKIPRKHLLMLEPGISEPQTGQMKEANLQLVVPQPIQETYADGQRGWLWSLGDFIRDVGVRSRNGTSRVGPLFGGS